MALKNKNQAIDDFKKIGLFYCVIMACVFHCDHTRKNRDLDEGDVFGVDIGELQDTTKRGELMGLLVRGNIIGFETKKLANEYSKNRQEAEDKKIADARELQNIKDGTANQQNAALTTFLDHLSSVTVKLADGQDKSNEIALKLANRLSEIEGKKPVAGKKEKEPVTDDDGAVA